MTTLDTERVSESLVNEDEGNRRETDQQSNQNANLKDKKIGNREGTVVESTEASPEVLAQAVLGQDGKLRVPDVATIQDTQSNNPNSPDYRKPINQSDSNTTEIKSTVIDSNQPDQGATGSSANLTSSRTGNNDDGNQSAGNIKNLSEFSTTNTTNTLEPQAPPTLGVKREAAEDTSGKKIHENTHELRVNDSANVEKEKIPQVDPTTRERIKSDDTNVERSKSQEPIDTIKQKLDPGSSTGVKIPVETKTEDVQKPEFESKTSKSPENLSDKDIRTDQRNTAVTDQKLTASENQSNRENIKAVDSNSPQSASEPKINLKSPPQEPVQTAKDSTPPESRKVSEAQYKEGVSSKSEITKPSDIDKRQVEGIDNKTLGKIIPEKVSEKSASVSEQKAEIQTNKSLESKSTDIIQNIKQISEQITKSNTSDITRVSAKEELVKAVESIIKKAIFEGNSSELIKVIRQAITDPVVKDALRVITSSGGDSAKSLKQLQELLQQLAKIKDPSSIKVTEKLENIKPIKIEEINAKITSKDDALRALVGILVDADKVNSRLVKEVQIETQSKLSQIQSTIDELVKLRVEQFISLSVKGYGVDGVTFKTLCLEAITELANRYGLTDQQRLLLAQILVNLTEGDFSHSKLPSDKDDQSKDPSKIQDKLKEIDPETKILTPEQIEAILKAEVEKLENFLKERDEIKRAKAESELANLLSELIDESSTYILDDDLEIVKVVKIKGIVLDNDTDLPIEGVSIYAGILGTFKTDNNGKFEILNVPKDTNYLISAVKEGFLFNPPYHSGTVDMAIEIVFRADIN